MLLESREIHAADGADATSGPDVEAIAEALRARGIRALVHVVKGQLSKYFTTGVSRPPTEAPPLYIEDDGVSVPVEEYTPLYRRYSGAIHLRRIYVEPQQLDEAKKIRSSLATAARST
jgi:hypothetical protein